MRRKLRTALMKEVKSGMGETFSDFVLIQSDPSSRELIYEKQVKDELSFFVRFFVYDGKEEFDIELAWKKSPSIGTKPEYPSFVVPMMPSDPPEEGGLSFTLHWLQENPAPVAVGWDFLPAPDLADFDAWLEPPPTVEALLPKVPGLVNDAMRSLEQLARPYFERLLVEMESASPPGSRLGV